MIKAWPFTKRAFVWAVGPNSGRRVAEILADLSIPVVLFEPGVGPPPPESGEETGEGGPRGLVRRARGERVIGIDGHVGRFRVRVLQKDGTQTVWEAGFVLVHREPAAPPVAAPCPGTVPDANALTLEALEALAAAGESPGAPASVGVWLDPCEGLPDRVAAERAFRALAGLKAKAGAPECTVLCRHVPLWGLEGQPLYDDLREKGVRFLRPGTESPALRAAGDALEIEVEDRTICDGPVRLLVDRLLSVGQPSPPAEAGEISEGLADPPDCEGFLQKDNAHLYPSRSFRKGIYYLGDCKGEQAPQELAEEVRAVLPEVLGPLASGQMRAPEGVRIDRGHCVSCLTCYRVCPHRAIDISQGPVPVPVDPACYGCGLCAALCPGKAIELVRKPPQAVPASREQGAARTVLFCCSRSAPVQERDGAGGPLPFPADTRVVEVPCACAVTEEMLLEALLDGAEQAVIVGCHPDNCVSQNGSSAGEKRARRVARYLAAAGEAASGDRVRFMAAAPNEAHRLAGVLGSLGKAGPEGETE